MHNGAPPPRPLTGDGVHKNVMFSAQLFLKELCGTGSLDRVTRQASIFFEIDLLNSRKGKK